MCMFFVWMLVCYVDVLCVDSGWLYQYFVCGYWMDIQLFLDDTRWMIFGCFLVVFCGYWKVTRHHPALLNLDLD